MKKRLLSVMLVCCMILTMLSACGIQKKGDDPVKDPVKDQGGMTKKDIDESLEQIEDAGIEIDEDIKDMLGDIDEADLEAANALNASVNATADLPEGWEKDEDSPMMFSAMNGFNMVMVTGTPLKGNTDVKAYCEETIEQMKKYFAEAIYSDVENTKMAGYDGAQFSIDIELAATLTQRQEYFYFFKDGNAYMIQGAYMSDDEAGAKEVQKVMDSVKIN